MSSLTRRDYLGLKLSIEKVSTEPSSKEMLEYVDRQGLSTIWHRFLEQQPQCGFGLLGLCCNNCGVGPCRIDPTGYGACRTSCGANADTIVARNFARHVAAGTSSYADLFKEVFNFYVSILEGKSPLKLQDTEKLQKFAKELSISCEGKSVDEISRDIMKFLEYEVSKIIDEDSKIVSILAPSKRVELLRKLKLIPKGLYREVIELLHCTHEGVNADPKDLIYSSMRCSIASLILAYLSSELQDIISGTPKPRKGPMGLRTLSEDMVNIVVRIAKRPLLRRLAELAKSKEVEQMAINVNAIGVQVIAPANYVMTELALATGLVDVYVTDYLCTMPAITEFVKNYHTKIVTTSPTCKIPEAIHMEVNPENIDNIVMEIIKLGIEAFKNRNYDKVYLPKTPPEAATVGFSIDAVIEAFKGVKPIVEALSDGKIKGIGIVFGCTNPKIPQHLGHVTITRELIKNDILVLGTGCWSIAAGLAGLLKVEAKDRAGEGLRKLCQELNIPPCLLVGACAENAKIAKFIGMIAEEANKDISEIPVIASAPEWMAEEILTASLGFITLGITTHLGTVPPILGSSLVTKLLTEDLEVEIGSKYIIEPEPEKAAKILIEHVSKKWKK